MVKLILGLSLSLYLVGCGTWEVRFGVSEYNQSKESRGYSEEVKAHASNK